MRKRVYRLAAGLLIARGQEHTQAKACELTAGLEAEAAVSSGDECGAGRWRHAALVA